MPRICDYEGSRYRTEFWQNQNREYEDQVERLAMQKLLPPRGERLIEVGAGFGRLVDLYQGYDQIVLMDYARTQLEEARKHLGADDRFLYVVGDVYRMPFVSNLFDTLTMVRVMHHIVDVPAALSQLHQIIRPGGVAVVEHASKLHLKSLLRWLAGSQEWNPFDPGPVEFVEMNFNFHPVWMRRQFRQAGFEIKNIRTISHYRLNLLKRLLPTGWLVKLDSMAQPTGRWWQLTPSIFIRAQTIKSSASPARGFFLCPSCGASTFSRLPYGSAQSGDAILRCETCQARWLFSNGIYDFKTALTD